MWWVWLLSICLRSIYLKLMLGEFELLYLQDNIIVWETLILYSISWLIHLLVVLVLCGGLWYPLYYSSLYMYLSCGGIPNIKLPLFVYILPLRFNLASSSIVSFSKSSLSLIIFCGISIDWFVSFIAERLFIHSSSLLGCISFNRFTANIIKVKVGFADVSSFQLSLYCLSSILFHKQLLCFKFIVLIWLVY